MRFVSYDDSHLERLTDDKIGVIDLTDPVRPDSCYGTTKSFGEDLGRYYVERYEYPRQFYALRICSVLPHRFDHPYGRAERRAGNGKIKRDSDAYERSITRAKSTWHSRRDFAQLVECCLADQKGTFDIFNSVSDNNRRWFSSPERAGTPGVRTDRQRRNTGRTAVRTRRPRMRQPRDIRNVP